MTSGQDIVPSEPQKPSETSNVSDTERWGTLISGGALVLLGLRQGSLRGALTALTGGGLIYRGVTAQNSIKDDIQDTLGMNDSIRVEKTVTISNKSPEELYQFWRNFENLPHFMKHLKHVTVINDQRSHWIATAPMGASVEWDAEIVNEQPNHLIAWASVEGADIDNSGFVRFTKAPHDRGTEVKVVLEYNPPGGAVTATLAKLFGEEPKQQIGDDLRRFKMLMEAGEIATTEGQPSGRK
ncbi:Oligoketide cyclase/lipid transport protein homolog [uncultured Coleofasciculus sp.]|uniref:Oligoketide cyclase/lipid transport protein homolog n=1 Tax=uncultured Coleofasciculus sp. TaxID=1267456 RepID=A0A6J4KCD9_9CYAN|nr:Oligoketide cyclase/lipid transport protein homolog [uncultured Coleofasciculus sp.]